MFDWHMLSQALQRRSGANQWKSVSFYSKPHLLTPDAPLISLPSLVTWTYYTHTDLGLESPHPTQSRFFGLPGCAKMPLNQKGPL